MDLAETEYLSSADADDLEHETEVDQRSTAPLHEGAGEDTADNDHETPHEQQVTVMRSSRSQNEDEQDSHRQEADYNQEGTSFRNLQHHSRAADHGERFVPESLSRTFSTGIDMSMRTPVRRRTGDVTGSMARLRKPPSQQGINRTGPRSLPQSVPSTEGLRRPSRNDTEARIGLSIVNASSLFNAVQDDPQSLLARMIQGNLYDVLEVKSVMLAYVLFIVLLQIALAVTTDGGALGFIPLVLVYILMETRAFVEDVRTAQRITEQGRTSSK